MVFLYSHTVIAAFLLAGVSQYANACFPAKYWISCLLDTCKFGGKCPGDPTAECRLVTTQCDGCKAVWYTKSGQRASCGVQRNLKLCPGGEAVMHCKVNSCKWPCSHPDFRSAQCRQSYCGQCAAEYFINNKWTKCPSTSVETLPHDKILGDSCQQVPCPSDVCTGETCPAVPKAVCRPDGCNVCRATWFLDNTPVDCLTGDVINDKRFSRPLSTSPIDVVAPLQRECAPGESYTTCDMSICRNKTCQNFPNAVCRSDGCGICKDTWYLNNQLVDCLSTQCPPNVPIVKCVDDPCKYFRHYCPAAECRASQCGKCEANFFVNGQKVDCTMPPKVCPDGVEKKICPWYTCPSNICPSDTRLMCRIDPCGSRCDYEFIDIYNEEPVLCRVFDGDGSRRALRLLEQQKLANATLPSNVTVPLVQPLPAIIPGPQTLPAIIAAMQLTVTNASPGREPVVQTASPSNMDPTLTNTTKIDRATSVNTEQTLGAAGKNVTSEQSIIG